VMTGTNDIFLDSFLGIQPGSQTQKRIVSLVKSIRGLGSVPILSTLPPVHASGFPADHVAGINAVIAAVARKRRVPLINLWRGLTRPRMIEDGLSSDELHLRAYPHDDRVLDPVPGIFTDSVNFSPEALRYGANRRNLICLQTLATLDRIVDGEGRGS
ncbi:MAG: SGNH/GDSL hydrolase family protein, partial [Solirubrobacterales bacterium]